MTNDDLHALVARLRAPAYWLSGSEDQHEGDNEAPLEAADAIEALMAELHASEKELQRQVMQAEDRAERAEAALRWYGEQARLARMIHSEGDAGRIALADDGGKRARAVLAQTGGEDGDS